MKFSRKTTKVTQVAIDYTDTVRIYDPLRTSCSKCGSVVDHDSSSDATGHRSEIAIVPGLCLGHSAEPSKETDDAAEVRKSMDGEVT